MRPSLTLPCFVLLTTGLADVFSDLGTTREQTQVYLVNSLTSSFFSFPGNCRKIPAEQRSTVVSARSG